MAVSLYVADEGFLDDVEVANLLSFERALHDHMNTNNVVLMDNLNKTGALNDDIKSQLKAAVEDFKKTGSW